jgi:SEC-C motif
MDAAHLHFAFAGSPPDSHKPQEWEQLLEERSIELDLHHFEAALFMAIGNQVIANDPPEVWTTIERLRGLGKTDAQVRAQINIAFTRHLRDAMQNREPKASDYVADLERLPMPAVEDVLNAFERLLVEHGPLPADELVLRTATAMGLNADDGMDEEFVEMVFERLIFPDGPLHYLPNDTVVHLPTILKGTVLTHRVTEFELEHNRLDSVFDLGPLIVARPLSTHDGASLDTDKPHGFWHSEGPWLSEVAVGDLVAVTVTDSQVKVEVVQPRNDHEHDQDTLVTRLRAVYDRAFEEPEMPVDVIELAIGLLYDDPQTFSAPRPPLSELCAKAGLARRGNEVCHDESGWANRRSLQRATVIEEEFDSEDQRNAARAACSVADDPDAANDTDIAHAQRALRDDHVFDFVLSEVVDECEPDRAAAFAAKLIAAAKRPTDQALARFLAAHAAEMNDDYEAAEQHLHLAVEANPELEPACDHLALYLFVKGDAAGAARLWRRIGAHASRGRELAVIEPFLSAGPAMGRNEPCFCGSGKKYKQCHLGQPMNPPLADRVLWLWGKAAAWIEAQPEGRDELAEYIAVRIGEDSSERAIMAAWRDPAVHDIAIHEGDWLLMFLDEIGRLLPDDEQMLARTWVLNDREVHEVTAIDRTSITVRSLHSGDTAVIRRSPSLGSPKPGTLFCGRVVSDGTGHQVLPGAFNVRPGYEAALMERLDEGDGYDIMEWLAKDDAPPTIQTREGEPMVLCETTLTVDGTEARRFLDNQFEEREGDWVELHPITKDERVVRATYTLDGATLSIVTHSEPRMDRSLAAVKAALPDAVVTSSTREPFDMSKHRMPGAAGSVGTPPTMSMSAAPLSASVRAELQDRFEQQWISEPVPALGGLTPIEAAADPTRRETVIRLIASFPPSIGDAITMRPDRLSELLGL